MPLGNEKLLSVDLPPFKLLSHACVLVVRLNTKGSHQY